MKVAIVTDSLPDNVGGIERFAVIMANKLKKRNMEVVVYDRGCVDWQYKWFDKLGLEVPRRSKLLGKAAAEKISQISGGVDVIIQNGTAGWNLRQLTQIPRIVIHHGTMRGWAAFPLPSNIKWRTKVARYVITDRILGGLEQYTAAGAVSVAVSSAVAEELRQYYGGIKSIVIPVGIDIEHFVKRDRAVCRKKFGIGMDEFVACFTGRSDIQKGLDVLRDVAIQAWSERPWIKFLVAIDTIPEGWPSNVIFIKNVNYNDIPDVYSAADVFLFPTRYEGCSASIIEAMVSELPVITGLTGYAKDLQRDLEEMGPFILAPNDAEPYWRALKQLEDDAGLAHKVGVVGAEYVRQNNSLDTMIDSYVKLIEQVARGGFCL